MVEGPPPAISRPLATEIALNLSRVCGNPTGFARLQPGEVVVDLGCGGGIDVVLAAHKVGSQGKVVGIDFAPQMIERAKQAVAASGLESRDIDLLVADMTKPPLPDGFAHAVISNCVINLCLDKEGVYREAFRILRPGGRLAISNIVMTAEIDADPRERIRASWAGCLGGTMARISIPARRQKILPWFSNRWPASSSQRSSHRRPIEHANA